MAFKKKKKMFIRASRAEIANLSTVSKDYVLLGPDLLKAGRSHLDPRLYSLQHNLKKIGS